MVKTVIVMVLLCSLASQAQAHGMKLGEGKTLMYDRTDNIMVKIELDPNDLQFNQENQMEVTVIDVSEGGIFNNDIQLNINQLDAKYGKRSIFSGESPMGMFRQPITFQVGGAHEIELYLPGRNKMFKFKFELKDSRSFAQFIVLTTIVLISIFICLIGLKINYRRNQ